MNPIPGTLFDCTGGIPGIARKVYTRDSLLEALRAITSAQTTGGEYARGLWNCNEEKMHDWTGARSWEQLEGFFARGIPGMIPPALLHDASQMVIERMELRAGISSHHAQAGDEVDIGLFMAGEPECMLAPLWQAEKPCITLHAPIGYSHKVQHSAVKAHGVAVSAAIMALEAAGYAVELVLWQFACPKHPFKEKKYCKGAVTWRKLGWKSGPLGLGFKAKESNQSITTDELGFMICHPAFYRGAILHLAGNGNGIATLETGRPVNEYTIHCPAERAALAAEYAQAHGNHSRGVWLPSVQDSVKANPTAEQAASRTREILRGMGFAA